MPDRVYFTCTIHGLRMERVPHQDAVNCPKKGCRAFADGIAMVYIQHAQEDRTPFLIRRGGWRSRGR